MSLFTASSGEYFAFIENYLFETLLSAVFFVAVLTSPVLIQKRVGRWLAVGASFCILAPLAITYPEMASDTKYHDEVQESRAKGYSPSFAKIEAALSVDLVRRFPLIKNLGGIVDTVKMLSHRTDLTSSWTDVTADDGPDLLVIGIGESLRSRNMGLYGYGRQTTPLMAELGDKLKVYGNAYAAGTNTYVSLPAALTKFGTWADPSKSIINLAKDAGYETYWISNQSQYGKFNFSVSVIARQADYINFPSSEDAGHDYDAVLLTKLKQVLSETSDRAKRLVILHFYGSHFHFRDRYPAEFSVYGEDSSLDQYDNTVVYQDFIQSEVLKLVSLYDGQYLFFADHGLGAPDGPIPLSHDVRLNPSLDSVAVPLFMSANSRLDLDESRPISLFYFECIFSIWSGISAAELVENDYCETALGENSVKFLDVSLKLRQVQPAYNDDLVVEDRMSDQLMLGIELEDAMGPVLDAEPSRKAKSVH